VCICQVLLLLLLQGGGLHSAGVQSSRKSAKAAARGRLPRVVGAGAAVKVAAAAATLCVTCSHCCVLLSPYPTRLARSRAQEGSMETGKRGRFAASKTPLSTFVCSFVQCDCDCLKNELIPNLELVKTSGNGKPCSRSLIRSL